MYAVLVYIHIYCRTANDEILNKKNFTLKALIYSCIYKY